MLLLEQLYASWFQKHCEDSQTTIACSKLGILANSPADLQQPGGDDAVILQPQPTRDPNDPLVRTSETPQGMHTSVGL